MSRFVRATTYPSRRVSHLGLETIGGWRMKIYGVTLEDREPRDDLVRAALAVAREALPRRDAASVATDGYGFCTIHESVRLCYVLVHWWAESNEVHQRLFSAPVSGDMPFAVHDSPAIGCVWELGVNDHERRAWMAHVLARPTNPAMDAYLASTISGRY